MEVNTVSNRPRLILGVDPGLTGGLAVYDPLRGLCDRTIPMPTIAVPNKRKYVTDKTGRPVMQPISRENRLIIDPYGLSHFIGHWASEIQYAVIEDVHAMPGQGVSSMFTFGRALGMVQAAVASYMIPIYFIKASVWKSGMNLSKDKRKSLEMAREMFPANAEDFQLLKHDGRAEALLLAVFASRHIKIKAA